MRPILGSGVRNAYSLWSDPWPRQRTDSQSSSDIEWGSVASPAVSPIGSPLNQMSLWMCDTDSGSQSKESQRLRQMLCETDFWRSEFERNGKDVPFGATDSSTHALAKEFQLFGADKFSYAHFQPSPTTRAAAKPSPNLTAAPTLTKTKRRVKTQLFCSFCKNNNETPEVYTGHVVKDMDGRTTCPILRRYNCPKCKCGGGDYGHTLRYCPLNKPGSVDYQPSIIKILKNCRSADGKKKLA